MKKSQGKNLWVLGLVENIRQLQNLALCHPASASSTRHRDEFISGSNGLANFILTLNYEIHLFCHSPAWTGKCSIP